MLFMPMAVAQKIAHYMPTYIFWEMQQERAETGNDVYKVLIHVSVAVSQWYALSVALTIDI